MRVLIACEESAAVRDAFRKRGHDAWSCDTQPTRGNPKWHFECSVQDTLRWEDPWDLIIAFPPCTHLAVSGARWFKEKVEQQHAAIEFARWLINYEYCDKVAVENPIGILSTKVRKPDQIIQPWQFGHGEVKATCLWLKNLPKLVPTNVVNGREAKVHKMAPGPNRARDRSKTYQGIADAMANQWGTA